MPSRVIVRPALFIGLATTAAVMAACGGGPGSAAQTTASGPINTAIPNKKITLTMWDQEAQNQLTGVLQAAIKQFEAMHPSVSFKRVAPPGLGNEATAESDTQTKLAASSPNPPDLIEGDTLPAGVYGPLVRAGLLRPLDAYVKAYGWDKRFASVGGLTFDQYSSKSGQWGSGSVYGIPYYGTQIGIFYNKQLLAKTGVPLPKTLAEFESSLAAAKRKGITPIVLGESDQDGGGWMFDELLADFMGGKQLTDWVLNKPGTTLINPQALQAAKTQQSWAQKGYFTPGFTGNSLSTAQSEFSKGQGLYTFSLNILAPTNMGNNLGWLVLPGTVANKPPGDPAASNWSFGIPTGASAEHADAAAAFLDLLSSPKFQNEMATKYGQIPALAVSQSLPSSQPPVAKDKAAAWNLVRTGGTAAPFLGSGTEIGYVYTKSIQAVQDMLSGHATPQDILQRIEGARASYLKTQGK